jgi:hypothetical protein
VLRAGIVRNADPALREHELYAYYYDRVDQPAVAHGVDQPDPSGVQPRGQSPQT